MDERKPPKTASGIVGPVAPERGAEPGTDSTVVFFGDPARVREGFALALHAMGSGVSMADADARDPSGQENDHA
jgi:hypothetical protein